MKLLLSLLLFVSTVSYAQPSDFIILKKKNKTVTTYYAGSQIEFTTLTGAYHKGLINRIHNDTIYLQEFISRSASPHSALISPIRLAATGIAFIITS